MTHFTYLALEKRFRVEISFPISGTTWKYLDTILKNAEVKNAIKQPSSIEKTKAQWKRAVIHAKNLQTLTGAMNLACYFVDMRNRIN